MKQPITVLALIALGFGTTAQAQTDAARGTVPAGRAEQDLRPPPEPARRPAIAITAPQRAEQAPAGAAQVMLTLGSVKVSGNTALPTAALEAAWADSIGQRVSLARVFEIAAAISAQYRQAGYVLSQAIVPAQELSADKPAEVQFQVLEGYVDKISFTGVPAAQLEAYLAPVRAERPLRLATLERSLLLINDLAGVTTQATLRAGTTALASDLEIAVARATQAFSVSAHNRLNPAQGDVRLQAAAEWRQVMGDFDRHSVQLYSSGDKRLNLAAYAGVFPIQADGLKLQLNASSSRSVPKTVVIDEINTRSENLSAGFSFPALRGRQTNLALRAALAGADNRTLVAGIPATDDRLRSLRAGLTFDHADDASGISLLDVEVSRGLSGLGASEAGDAGLNGAEPEFTKLNAYASRLQFLGNGFSLLLAVQGQASQQHLTSAEQLGLGGDFFLRAFDPSEVTGDYGLAGKVELRWNFAWGQGDGGVSATLYAYADAGKVSKRAVAGGSPSEASLAAAGLGLRFSTASRVRGYVELAKPLHRDVISQGNQDPRVFAGLGIDF